jgi:hypothetical protein
MQALLADLLQFRFKLRRRPFVINGQVPAVDRKNRIDKFQSSDHGFDVLILSPRAGGVGLNITAANHVIHVSRWWNPAVEDQCNDRAYRIGQTKPVSVYCPIAVHPEFGDGSFDVALHNLLERKRALSRDMLISPESSTDVSELYRGTVSTSPTNLPNPDDLDAMDPVTFENWTRSRLRKLGYEPYATLKTHDAGADGILRHPQSGRTIILQCKKYAPDTACSANGIMELMHAREAYGLPDAMLIVVTTASRFTRDAQEMARRDKVRLVARDQLRSWGLTDPFDLS